MSAKAAPRMLGRASLALAAAAVGLVLGEVGLRAYFWTQGVGRSDVDELLLRSQRAPATNLDTDSVFGLVQPSRHADIVYEIKPNASGRFRGRPIETNSFGMRGAEVTLEKPEGVVRIVGLGDSHMFGWGVGQNETYLAVAERQLNRSAPDGVRYEMLNFAAPGYNTAIEVAVYEHKARFFAPDLVVIHYVGNDLDLPHHLQPPRSARPRDWFLVELFRGIFGRKDLEGELVLLPHDLGEVPAEIREGATSRYQYMLGRKGFESAMNKLGELTRDPRVPVVIASLGERSIVEEVATRLGFGTVDFVPSCRRKLEVAGIEITSQSWKKTLLIPHDGHPSIFAHQAYADALIETIRNLKLERLS